MKRLSYLIYIICLMVLISGCGKATNASEDKDTLVIATNPSFNGFPEILEFIKPKLKEEGIDLKIEYVNDIIQPNELVKLKEGVGLQATKKDIIENKRNFKIIELDQGMSAKSLDDVDLALILGGYQTAVGLHLKDALLAEDSSSEFIGVITTRPDNQNDEKIQKLKKVLHTPEVKKFIEETFHGDIIPVFE